MAKNPNKKTTQWSEPMTGSMKFFLAGCVAELYLLIVRRYYINGNVYQMISWHDLYLKLFAAAGAILLIAGGILLSRKMDKLKEVSYYLCGFGAFLLIADLLVLWNMSLLGVLSTIVPLIMLVTLVWGLYDRECALSMTMLGCTLIALWAVRRFTGHATLLAVLVVVYLVLVLAVALLVKQKKLTKFLPAKADSLPIYVSAALSVIGLAATFLGTTIAYYTMWVLAFVTFALVVYYTVKQL